MGTLSLEVEDLGLENHLLLGLGESGKEDTRKPQVLSYLSFFLERAVEKNEKLLEATEVKDIITIFHGSAAPQLGIRQYIDRIFKYSHCSPSCFIVAHIYMEKFVQRTRAILTSLNVHRLLITSIMVAAKFIDDAFFNNAYYARVGGISTYELNKLEMKFLFGLEFRLHVCVNTFDKYCSLLLKEGNAELHIERSIKACRITENWSKQDDSSCPTSESFVA